MDIYAHRGSSGTHPENTLSAFREAARLPVHGVEFDVHMTEDGELVIIHDETIDRTSNGSGLVKDMKLEKLRTFDYGSWFSAEFEGESIPTLQEVFEVFAQTSHHINIELKSDIFPYDGMVEKVVALVGNMKLDSRVVLSSFDHEAIHKVKKIAPHLETAALFMEVLMDPLDYVRNIPADALHLTLPAALRPSIDRVITEGFTVRVFTVNKTEYVEAIKAVGAHAIFTDFPEEMSIYLSEKK